MSRWFRVFGSNDVPPAPAALLEEVRRLDVEVSGRFRGDDLGWFRAELTCPDEAPLVVERFLNSEEGIRAELNTWAAWLESAGEGPEHVRLMQHLISTQQVFTLGPIAPDADSEMEQICLALCRFLARETAGVYQADTVGFCAAEGTVLVPEA